MHANERTIRQWLSDIDRGSVQLPRFQRQVAWKHVLVERFLQAILDERPLGIFLVLEVDPDNQPFRIRPIEGADNGSERCRQHLLDGQQRLTALWQTFKDIHKTHTFYVTFKGDGSDLRECKARAVARRGRDRATIGRPELEYAKRWIPATAIAPTDDGINQCVEWRKGALAERDDLKAQTRLEALVERLRSCVGGTHIPYFSLPQDTSADEAIDIFVETNRSSVQLTPYDIAVAQMEAKTQDSLERLKDELVNEVPGIKALEPSVGDLILKLQCLRQKKKPTLGNYDGLDFQDLKNDWDKVAAGIRWAVDLLANARIRNAKQLPTLVPLRVLPLLAPCIPDRGPARARAMQIARRYLWGALLTNRYDRQANDRLKKDHDWLVRVLKEDQAPATAVKIFADDADVPSPDELKEASWPSGKSRLGRAILAAASLSGALDIASNDELLKKQDVHLHHIFPKAMLRDHDGELDPDLALNCMLLHAPTNQDWAHDMPGDYLLKAIKESDEDDVMAAKRVEKRLETHCLPSDELLSVRADNVQAGRKPDVAAAYERFLNRRERLIRDRIETLLDHGGLNAS